MQDSEVIQLAALTCLQAMMTLYLQRDQILCTYGPSSYCTTSALGFMISFSKD